MLVASVDVHESVALVLVVEPVGGEARVTVGFAMDAATTAQVALALAEPLVLVTVTVKVCVPTARPE
ncbi:MAG: hypothetical protein ABSC36_00955 [Gaiellaceae bacterium]|jgi:hypothetical protein